MNKELKKRLEKQKNEQRSIYLECMLEKYPAGETLALITAILKEYDIELKINNDSDGRKLTFWTKPEYHLERNTRNAGRRKTFALQKDKQGDEIDDFYRYSDVVYMMQSKKDDEIMKILGMAPATYYRHKKGMKESEYYKKLDPSKLTNREYLKSVEVDRIF